MREVVTLTVRVVIEYEPPKAKMRTQALELAFDSIDRGPLWGAWSGAEGGGRVGPMVSAEEA
jgi:hypothetical protein